MCKTSKRGHILAGIKIVDIDTQLPNTNKLMFDFESRGQMGLGVMTMSVN